MTLGHRIFALIVGAAAVGSSAGAQQSSPAADIVVTGQQYDNKVVCRSEAATGSRFQSRVCHTNKEWDEMREQERRAAHEMIDKPFLPDCRNSPGGC
jgi:hypothetical protein